MSTPLTDPAYKAVAKEIDALEVIPGEKIKRPVPASFSHGRQFKKGLLDEALNKAIRRTQRNGRTVAENMALVMIEKGLAGDNVMIKLICERTGGLPTVRVEEETQIHVQIERIG